MEMKIKQRSHRYNINRHGHKYNEYKKKSQHDYAYIYEPFPSLAFLKVVLK